MGKEIAVLFDMDGVLINSVGLNWQAYNTVLEARYGRRVLDEDITQYVGRTLRDQTILLSENLGIAIDPIVFRQESDLVKQGLFKTLYPQPGVVTLLEQCRGANTPVAVGTSSSRDMTLDRLTTASLLPYFDVCVTEDDVPEHKPHPAVYLRAAKLLGMEPEKCVVIEDAPSGIEAAKRAGMQCIGIITPYVEAEQLESADLIVASVGDLSLDGLRSFISLP